MLFNDNNALTISVKWCHDGLHHIRDWVQMEIFVNILLCIEQGGVS